ncbi:MAG: NnrU family protein [Acetobacteraceae bacterium]|nr:NnrU family protein [Acetobacteraceae bacterium]
MGMLAAAALVWIGAHLGIAGTGIRRVIAGRIGEGAFRGVFSLVSFATIAWLIVSYRRADTTLLWAAPAWLRVCILAVMLVACLLLVASVAAPNPTAVGSERALGREPRGIQRVTRHPMLWAFALWAGAHVLGNGDTASLLFFGAFLVTALAGMPSIDAKVARRDPPNWQVLAAGTSILPFGAIAAGRNRLVTGEIGWVVPVLGVVLWAALFVLHPWLFGASPLPGW